MSAFVPPESFGSGDRVTARGLFFLLLAVYTATFAGTPDHLDSEAEFQTTSAIARRASFAVGGTPESDGMRARSEEALAGGVNSGLPLVQGEDGEWYSWFGAGQALVGVPLYVAGRAVALLGPGVEERHAERSWYGVGRSEYHAHFMVGWRNALLGALTCWLVFEVARRSGVSRRAAFLAALTYGLASFAWPQARSNLSDVQAGCALFAAYAMILRVRERYRRLRKPRRLELVLFGVSLGVAFLTRVLTAPAIAVLLVAFGCIVKRGRERRAGELGTTSAPLLPLLAWSLGPALACMLLWLVFNAIRFGNPLESGYGAAVFSGTFFGNSLHHGLAGLVLSPGRGLVWLAPALLLLPVGWSQARHRRELCWRWVVVAISLAVFVPPAMTHTWHGAWTYGPRYVLPALPFLWIGVALAIERGRESAAVRALVAALCLLRLASSLPGVLVDHMTHQDLGMQALIEERGHEYPPEVDVDTRDTDLFQHMQWDWSYAAPWAHWRILRHRVARGSEQFDAHELYGVEGMPPIEPGHERARGFRHLAWVDLCRELGGWWLLPWLLVGALFGAGLRLSMRGLDPAMR